MVRQLEIPITNGILVLSESELLNSLPIEVIEKALRRGKGLKRFKQSQAREVKLPAKYKGY